MTAPFTAMRFDVTCRTCGEPLEVVNGGAVQPYEAKAVAGCTACRTEWLLTVRMDPVRPVVDPLTVKPRTVVPPGTVCPVSGVAGLCGTDASYRRGCREQPCRNAHNECEKDRLARLRRRRAA